MPDADKVQEILGTIAAVAPAAAGLAGVLGRLLDGRVIDPGEVRRELDRARAESSAAIARLDDDHARRLVETSRALRDSAGVVEGAPAATAPAAMRAAGDVLQVVRDEVARTQAALLEGVRQAVAGIKAEVDRVAARADGVATHVAEKVGVEVEGRIRRLEANQGKVAILEAALLAADDRQHARYVELQRGPIASLADRVAALEALAGIGGPQPPDVAAGPPPSGGVGDGPG